jgi:hypothetical protein
MRRCYSLDTHSVWQGPAPFNRQLSCPIYQVFSSTSCTANDSAFVATPACQARRAASNGGGALDQTVLACLSNLDLLNVFPRCM